MMASFNHPRACPDCYVQEETLREFQRWHLLFFIYFLLLTSLIKSSSYSLKTEVFYYELRALSISFVLPTASSWPGMVWAHPKRGCLPYLHYSVGISSTSPAMWGELQGWPS